MDPGLSTVTDAELTPGAQTALVHAAGPPCDYQHRITKDQNPEVKLCNKRPASYGDNSP